MFPNFPFPFFPTAFQFPIFPFPFLPFPFFHFLLSGSRFPRLEIGLLVLVLAGWRTGKLISF